MNSSVAINSRRASEDLGLWEPKRALTLEAARAHTQRIRILRYVLMGASTMLVMALIWQFVSDSGGIEYTDDPSESVKMVNPRYSGRTGDGLPFYLTSDTAIQRLAEPDLVALEKPVLEFIRDTGVESSFVVAETGSFNDMKKILQLRKEVNLQTDDGYQCDTSHARIFNQDKRIEGDEPIDCHGEFGQVDGKSYAIEDSYKKFIFKDGMTALINQERGSSSDDGPLAFGGDGPIDIKADRGIYYGSRTDLRGNVIVVQDGARLTSDKMDIFRIQKDGRPEGSLKLGAIQKIVADGNFRYKTDENDIRGKRGIYDRDKGVITVIDNVVVIQPNGNRVETQRLIYNTRTKAIRFTGQNEGDRNKIVIPGSRQ